ncbi:hypothetical protein QE428_000855 [Microbacterium sp. SORGH_AS 505]|nr:hypothetical protein [Microbacterium sp. SORGH_AS_0505]
MARLIDVSGLAQCSAELGQAGLDLRVPAHPLDAPLAERAADEVRSTTRDTDEPVVCVGPRAVTGDRRLEEVTEAVQFVAPLEVGPARSLAGAAEHGVDVAVRLLGGGDPCDDGAEVLL